MPDTRAPTGAHALHVPQGSTRLPWEVQIAHRASGSIRIRQRPAQIRNSVGATSGTQAPTAAPALRVRQASTRSLLGKMFALIVRLGSSKQGKVVAHALIARKVYIYIYIYVTCIYIYQRIY